jgi:hypothetical protein
MPHRNVDEHLVKGVSCAHLVQLVLAHALSRNNTKSAYAVNYAFGIQCKTATTLGLAPGTISTKRPEQNGHQKLGGMHSVLSFRNVYKSHSGPCPEHTTWNANLVTQRVGEVGIEAGPIYIWGHT